MENKLKKIFAQNLNLSESQISDDSSYNSLKGWDSLKHLEIVGQIEKKFKISMEMDDIIAMDNFKHAKEIVGKYVNKAKK